MSALAVGLSVDWYEGEQAMIELCVKNLPEPINAPMVGFLTAEGQWIDGYSGWLEAADFVKLLDRVEKSPLLLATPAVRKQLEKHAAVIGAAADKSDWPAVLTAAREASRSIGRCPERDAIVAAEAKARAWAAAGSKR